MRGMEQPGKIHGGPRRRRGAIRQAILQLLDEGPLNGYALMATIEQRSGGTWRPSPGSMYPTLSQLADEQLIQAVERNGSRRYALTDAGRELARGCAKAPWEARPGEARSAQAELRELMHSLRLAAGHLAREGDPGQVGRAGQLLTQARQDLYRILAEDVEDNGAARG